MQPTNMNFDPLYWDNRYHSGQDGWDIGDVSLPLKSYFDQVQDKDLSILIPGCGRAYEAAYFFSIGFRNITIVDFSQIVVQELLAKFADTSINVIQSDIFALNGKFDIIVEQTLFCALDPSLRQAYVAQIYDLLNPDGKYVGLLFATEFDKAGPPFGGVKSEYLRLFQDKFEINVMDTCYNSIIARQGNELWINMSPKL